MCGVFLWNTYSISLWTFYCCHLYSSYWTILTQKSNSQSSLKLLSWTLSTTVEIGIGLSLRLPLCYILGIRASITLPICSKPLYPYSKASFYCSKLSILLLVPWALQIPSPLRLFLGRLTVLADKSTITTLHEEVWQHQHPSTQIFSFLASYMSILFHLYRWSGKWAGRLSSDWLLKWRLFTFMTEDPKICVQAFLETVITLAIKTINSSLKELGKHQKEFPAEKENIYAPIWKAVLRFLEDDECIFLSFQFFFMERKFIFILDHLRWKITQLLLISWMYFSKHTEHVNPVLLLMTVIHVIGIFSVKNVLQ